MLSPNSDSPQTTESEAHQSGNYDGFNEVSLHDLAPPGDGWGHTINQAELWLVRYKRIRPMVKIRFGTQRPGIGKLVPVLLERISPVAGFAATAGSNCESSLL